jgi:hypothetical protein
MQFKTLLILKLGLLIMTLISCQTGRGELKFETEPTILRGTWTAQAQLNGQTTLQPVQLELIATYGDVNHYTVLGTFKFSSDAALAVSGDVFGAGYETYTRARMPANLTLQILDGTTNTGFLACYWIATFADFGCSLEIQSGGRAGRYMVLNLKKP